jgi:hypothetical protein
MWVKLNVTGDDWDWGLGINNAGGREQGAGGEKLFKY